MTNPKAIKDAINADRKLFDSIVEDARRKAMNCGNGLAARWINAIEKAVSELEENPFMSYDRESNELLILSSSGNIYSANGICQCEAFKRRQPCFHRAAARLVRLYFEAAQSGIIENREN